MLWCKRPGEVQGLREVIQLVAQRSRHNQPVRTLRPLTLICGGGRGHTIGRVYIVPNTGPVLVGQQPDWHSSGTEWVEGTGTGQDPETGETWDYAVAQQVTTHEMVHRFEDIAVVLDEQRYESETVHLQCKCRTVRLDARQIRALLSDGRPRVQVGVTVLGHRDGRPEPEVLAERDPDDDYR